MHVGSAVLIRINCSCRFGHKHELLPVSQSDMCTHAALLYQLRLAIWQLHAGPTQLEQRQTSRQAALHCYGTYIRATRASPVVGDLAGGLRDEEPHQ
jgi:hypothetical protein